jgi:hypothetical protein
MRTIVELTEDQIEELRRYCLAEKVSRAEAIRRGVDLLVKEKQERRDRFLKALDAAFGSWKGHGIDGLEYQRQIRAEWDRDDR